MNGSFAPLAALSCKSVNATNNGTVQKMHELSEEQLEVVSRIVQAAAADKGRALNLSGPEYLRGILDGRFPPLELDELAAEGAQIAASWN